MKKTTLIIAFLISFLSQSQTKNETIDWLNSKFRETTVPFGGQFKIEIFKDAQNGEMLIITQKTVNKYFPGEDHYKVLIKNIEAVNTRRGESSLYLIIKAKDYNIYDDFKKQNVDEIEIYSITTTPDELIIRMQKGFIHLLNLMGNPVKLQKELFTN